MPNKTQIRNQIQKNLDKGDVSAYTAVYTISDNVPLEMLQDNIYIKELIYILQQNDCHFNFVQYEDFDEGEYRYWVEVGPFLGTKNTRGTGIYQVNWILDDVFRLYSMVKEGKLKAVYIKHI